MSLVKHHEKMETNSLFLILGIFITIIIGGLVEVVPLFAVESTIEKVQGVRPYSPLEQLGRDIYVREGCYNCHSQMIRPFRDEVERYGHYSLAAESQYDHPFQWASKRTGPDLARVGGKYSNNWHTRHLNNPRDVVGESIMPSYPHLLKTELNTTNLVASMKTLRVVNVPYTDEQIAKAMDDVKNQADATADHTALLARYPKAKVGDFDGHPETLSEMDALVAYLQILGTMVDFTSFDPASARNFR